jgi:DNA-binding XRE family transcriptional regulator
MPKYGTQDTIKSIEYGKCTPEISTVNKIVSGFSQNGVNFVERGKAYGVCFNPTEISAESATLNS